MPSEKKLIELIPKMYRWNFENMSLFVFIKAQQDVVPTIRIDQAIKNFCKYFNISEDEWDYDSIRATYIRLQKEFLNGCKHEITEED